MKKGNRSIGEFSKIKLRDFGTLVLTQGEEVSLTVEAEEDILPDLITEVRGSTLMLRLDEDWIGKIGKFISSIFSSSDYNVTYTLTCTDLKEISISGRADVRCDALSTEDLTLRVSGVGDMDFSHLDCDSLDVRISGRGEFSAAGRADHQEVHISGSGEYQAPNLAGQTVRLVISGQGNATVRAEENLNITISGLGQVNYYGRPKLRQVISGLGKSQRLNED